MTVVFGLFGVDFFFFFAYMAFHICHLGNWSFRGYGFNFHLNVLRRYDMEWIAALAQKIKHEGSIPSTSQIHGGNA